MNFTVGEVTLITTSIPNIVQNFKEQKCLVTNFIVVIRMIREFSRNYLCLLLFVCYCLRIAN